MPRASSDSVMARAQNHRRATSERTALSVRYRTMPPDLAPLAHKQRRVGGGGAPNAPAVAVVPNRETCGRTRRGLWTFPVLWAA